MVSFVLPIFRKATQMTMLAVKLYCVIVCVIPISVLCTQPNSNPIVELPNGKIRGLDHGHYLSFESIPYAEPPVGENRFEAPKPYSRNWTDILDATIPPVKCMQWDQFLLKEDQLDGVEDCLTVNVYTPSIVGDKTYPVLVLIHGGAFMFGTAAENGHDIIMKNGNMVVVKINYRLGPLGFLSTEDDVISGNFGLKDQLLALKWTKANVAAFNGNPDQITVIGFSAGSASVHLHMLNKEFENIATSAISQSGTAFCGWAIMKKPARRAIALSKYVDCPTESSDAIKACLQKKDAADIVRAVRRFHKIGYNPAVVFGPVIESKKVKNAFLSENPEDIVKNGKSAEVPWLASYSKDDGGYNAAEFMQKDKNGMEMIEILNERWNELAPENLFFENYVDEKNLDVYSNNLKQKYLGNGTFTAKNYLAVQRMFTDLLFANGVKKAWKLHQEYTRSPVYGYIFDTPAPFGLAHVISKRFDIPFGTVHGDDFFLLFKSPIPDLVFTQTQALQSQKFIKMVEDFTTNRNLQFGDCEFVENTSSKKEFYAMQIKEDSCEAVAFEKKELENEIEML